MTPREIKVLAVAAGVAATMGFASWASSGSSDLLDKHPVVAVLALILNLPSFCVAAMATGNIHAPNAVLATLLAALQWAVTVVLLARRRGDAS